MSSSSRQIVDAAVVWADQHKGCGWSCRKCNLTFQRAFEQLSSEQRQPLVDAVYTCEAEDFEQHEPLLWITCLLDESELESFAKHLAQRAPFERREAQRLARLSAANQGLWRFDLRGRSSFCFHFHLHPTVAPALLAALIRSENEVEDALHVLDEFNPIATQHAALAKALPLWREARKRREADERAEWLRREQQTRAEAAERKAELAARELRFQTVEKSGPIAIIQAVTAADSRFECPLRWTKIADSEIACVPHELLVQTAALLLHDKLKPWRNFGRRINHLLASWEKSKERTTLLRELGRLILCHKLQAACDSRWALTYFPEEWADEVIASSAGIPKLLRADLLSKLMRLRKRSRWRDARKSLLRV